jgi:ABC-2 type transport system ATP-binding protein
VEALKQLPKVSKIENSIGFVYQIFFSTDKDMRGEVFDYAHDNGLKILQLHQKNTTLEKLFIELTTQK